ncbi:Clp protease [Pediococcus acidilactici]|nr:Clp protease [Pediococcus acidilactici]
MEKLYRVLSYGNQYLKIDVGKSTFFAHGVEVKAKVNKETGEVTLFISQEDLKKLG